MWSRLVFNFVRYFVCKFLRSKYQVGLTGDTRNANCLLKHSCTYYFIIFIHTLRYACFVNIGLGVGSSLRILLFIGHRNVLKRVCSHVNMSNP
jgi:hypothetical protein